MKTKTPHTFWALKLQPAGCQCDLKLSIGDKNFEATFSILDWHSRDWFRFKSKNVVFCFKKGTYPLSLQSFFITFIFDINYFLWKLKTSKRQGVSSLLVLELCQSKTLKVASKFLSPTLNFQSHWRPAGRNFGALKIWGVFAFKFWGLKGS